MNSATHRWLPLWVLLGSLALTTALCGWSVSSNAAERRLAWEQRAERFGNALANRVQSYIDTLPGLRALGLPLGDSSDAAFLQYIQAISLQSRFPGLALTFVGTLVADAERAAFVDMVRADRSHDPAGHPGFDIHPPGQRAQYMVIRHAYPFDAATVGYDLYDPQQNYRAAVDAAVTSGAYVATGPLQLARDRFRTGQPQLTNVVIRAATYRGKATPDTPEARRRAVNGVVGLSFRMTDIVTSVIAVNPAEGAHLLITDLDAQRQGQPATLFDSDWLHLAQPLAPSGHRPHTMNIDVADRHWRLVMEEPALPFAADANRATWLLGLLGVALSLSLAVMTRSLVQANLAAERRVDERSAALWVEKQNVAQSEGRYRMLVENSLEAVFRTDAVGNVLAANPAACALFGHSEAELMRLGRAGLCDMNDPRLAPLLAQRARNGHAQGLIRMLRAGGLAFEAEVTSTLYVDADGRTVASLTLRDVTERQQQIERQARLTAIIDATPEFVASTDPHGSNAFFNRAARRMMGREPGEDLSALTLAACHPPWAARIVREQGIPAAVRDGVWFGQTAMLAHDGREIPVSHMILCHRNAQGEVTQLSTVARDVSELRRAENEKAALEAQLRQSQKMESIGTLAGGVAHDFNNVLTAILGNVTLARQELAAEHPAQQNLARVHLAAVRARTLVQQILTFSRRAPQERSVQPLQPLVEEALALLRATLPATTRLEVSLAAERLAVRVDPAQVQQVVLNLCSNAWQALPHQHGLIIVTLAAADLRSPHTAPVGVAAGHYACLQVRDNGTGFDAATRERIFEPFFTTKPVGQGTGLGLSVVHGIVVASGGAIAVDSTPGAGACFTVYLPLAEGTAEAAPTVPSGFGSLSRQGESVLYVDDDEVVAITMQALLARLGYDVTCLSNGAAALAAISQQPGHFALVVTDFNMPEMSGLMLAEALRTVEPELPVVITSGYVTETLQERARALGVRAVLPKEHSLERLGELVHDILHRPAA